MFLRGGIFLLSPAGEVVLKDFIAPEPSFAAAFGGSNLPQTLERTSSGPSIVSVTPSTV